MACHENGCKKKAFYGISGGKATHCAEHGKKKDYIDIVNKLCTEKECYVRASFGSPDGKATHCAKHGNERGFINVVSKRCTEKECMKHPIFGPSGGKATHCAEHGNNKGYVDVVNKRCAEKECMKHPNFGPSGGKATYCSEHGNERGFINVVRKLCAEKECTKQPSYGISGGKATHCSEHGNERGFVDVVSKRCMEKECMKQPSYGISSGKATHCAEHGNKRGFVDVVSKRCVSSACSFYKNHEKFFASKINPENGKMELCYNCWTAMYPNLNKRKIRKEQFILAEVQNQIPELQEYFLTWDCKIPGQSCVAFKPDMAWEIHDTLLHIEIDEGGVNHEDDDHRLVEIHSASNKKYHVCIRFNTDKSIDGSPPCMKKITLSTGESVYDKDTEEWGKRMNKLIQEVRNAYEDAMTNKSVCGKRKLCF